MKNYVVVYKYIYLAYSLQKLGHELADWKGQILYEVSRNTIYIIIIKSDCLPLYYKDETVQISERLTRQPTKICLLP